MRYQILVFVSEVGTVKVKYLNQSQSLVGTIETQSYAIIRKGYDDGCLDRIIRRVREIELGKDVHSLPESGTYLVQRCPQL